MQGTTFCMVWRFLCDDKKRFSFNGKCHLRTQKLLSKDELRDAGGNQEPFKMTGDQENSSLSPVRLGFPWPGREQALRMGGMDRSRRCGRNLASHWSLLGKGWDGWEELPVTEMQWNIQRDTVHACSGLALLRELGTSLVMSKFTFTSVETLELKASSCLWWDPVWWSCCLRAPGDKEEYVWHRDNIC